MNQNVNTETMNIEEWLGWVMAGIVSVVGALAASVATLWARSEAKNSLAIEILQKRSDDCDKDRTDLHIEVARLEERVEQLEKDRAK